MEQQCAQNPLQHTSTEMGHQFSNGVKGNVRYSLTGARGTKREMVDEYKYGLFHAKLGSPRDVFSCVDLVSMSTASQQGDFKDRQHKCISIEAEAGTWLRDEPMDITTSACLHPSPSVDLLGTGCGGSGASEGKMEMGGGQCFTDRAGSPGCAADVSEDASAQRKGSSSTARLYAQLRATKIKESVIRDAIQRYGGGQKGLRGVIKAIMFWLEERNRYVSESSDACASQSESLSGPLEENDRLPWAAVEPGSLVDVQFGSFGSFNQSSLADLNSIMNTSSCFDDGGTLCDLRIGGSESGDCGEVVNREDQPNVFIAEPAIAVGLPGGPRSQLSGVSHAENSSLSSGTCIPTMRDYILRHEKVQIARMIRKLSPSPECSGLQNAQDVATFEDPLSHHNEIRHHSPSTAGFTSLQSSSELPAYGSAGTPPVSEISGSPGIFGLVGANPFAPGGAFSLSPSSPPPMDHHALDFTSFGMQGPMLIDESLGIVGAAPGSALVDRPGSLGYSVSPDDSADRKNSVARLGMLAESKATPAACTRLARKNRMDRNRKAALFQVNRGALESGALLSGKTGGMWSSGSLRTLSRSQGSPSEGQSFRTKDRRDQEHLEFLLQKVLRPSDVGNLGRVVLPKKDAESHLPWLGAREGIQFTCEDYDTGEKMMLRYRFWPNNKSRMYLLENTGDFVKKHQLQESDRMLIYRSQQQGIYIIRARKARDCVDGLPNQVESEETEGEGKEISDQNSPGGRCSSRISSYDRDVGTPEPSVCTGLEGVPEPVATSLGLVTSQDDLLNFADLPDAPMGEGTENLVRFPSLESFDVELLELGPVAADKQDSRSCILISEENQ